jgi:hypothetical protein
LPRGCSCRLLEIVHDNRVSFPQAPAIPRPAQHGRPGEAWRAAAIESKKRSTYITSQAAAILFALTSSAGKKAEARAIPLRRFG